jgi:hypothetical protein
MLVAIITILILGGGGAFGPMVFIDEARDNVENVITDEEQLKEVRADLKAMKGRAKDYSKAMNKLTKDYRKEFGDHDIQGDTMDAYWGQLLSLNETYSKDLTAMRFDLRDQMTREQWEALFPLED